MTDTVKKELPGACCLAAGGVVYAFFAVRCGASLLSLVAAFGALWLCVLLPGQVLAGILRRDAGVSLTLTLGFSAYSLCCVLSSVCGSGVPLAVLAAAGITGALWLKKRGSLPPIAGPRLPAPAVTALLVLFGLAAGRAAHPLAVGATVPQQDLYWNAGNAASFALGFPPRDLRFSGYTLTYHYLTELWGYGLHALCGISCYDAVAFVLPPALLAAALLALAELGQALWPGQRRAVLLPWAVLLLGGAGGTALLRGGSPFWNLFTIHLLTNINAVATATLLLAVFLVLVLPLSRDWGNARLWPAPLICFALLCAGKGPVAGLAALALLCAVVVTLPRLSRRDRVRALAFALTVLAVFGVFYRILFSAGAGASVTFSTHATLEKGAFSSLLAALRARSGLLYTAALPVCMVLQSFCMAPFAFPLFCLGGVRALRRLRDQNLAQLFCYALGCGGLLAFFLFDHPSMSQCYFAFAGLLAVDVNALDALPARKKPLLRAGAGALAVLSLFTGLCSCGYLAREGVQVLCSPETAVAEHPNYTPLTADEEAALLWLGDAMTEDALFATNRMHTGAAEEGLSNVYSGISGRRAYLESFKYAMTNLGVPAEEIGLRYGLMSELFSLERAVSPERAAGICRETGVTWLVYNRTLPGSDAGFADGAFEKRFENDTVVIYQLNLN